MFKKRFISMLVLLMTAATGAWADTTVTWTASDMSRIYIDFSDGEAYNNTIKGITVTSSGGGGAGASWEGTDIDLNSGSTTITFTSSVGNIKSIAITAEDIEMRSIPSGWTTDYSTLSWSGEASTTVPLPLSGRTEISGISEIVFTIGPATVAVTGVTLAPTSATLTLGETETVTLIPTVLPGDATDKSVTWSSSNEAVATVTDGVVTAVAAGEATITVTTTDGAKTATCAVTVAAPAASTYTVTLKEGTEDAANWTISPASAAENETVTINYAGTKSVKSVTAKRKTTTGNITVYFTDAQDYGDVHVYYWNDGPEWPGTAMTEVGTNEYSQKIYRAEIPATAEGIIFNGNGNQTVDITENIADGSWWYTTDQLDGWKNKVGYVGKYTENIDVTNVDDNKWTFTMPDYNVELDIEYYPAFAVTIDDAGVDASNWSATPTEQIAGQNVTLSYSGKKKVKSITIEKAAE